MRATAIPIAVVALAACSSDSGPPSDTQDAAMMVAIADGGFGTADASTADAALVDGDVSTDAGFVDTGVVDAGLRGSGPVTVFVSRDDFPFSSRFRVVAGDQTGQLLTETLTDNAGEAVVDVPAGGTVTVLVPDIFDDERFIFFAALGVESGDRITVIPPRFGPPPTAVATLNAEAPVAGATRYDIYFGCGRITRPSFPLTIPVPPPGCLEGRDRYPILVEASDDAGILAYAGVESARVAAPDDLSIDLGPWRVPEATIGARLVDVPVTLTSAAITLAVSAAGEDLTNVAGRSGITDPSQIQLSGSNLMVGDEMSVRIQASTTLGFNNLELWARGPRQAEWAISGSQFLPAVTEPRVLATARRRAAIQWSTLRPPPALDAVLVEAGWPELPEIDALPRWRVLAPPAATSPLILPELPSDVAAQGLPPSLLTYARVLLYEDNQADYRSTLNGLAFEIDRLTALPAGVGRQIRRSN